MHEIGQSAELTQGDTFTLLFSVTPPEQEAVSSSPGCLVVTWEAENVRSLGMPRSSARLQMDPVELVSPLVHVSTCWPADVVVGVAARVGISVHNSSTLTEELAVTVGNSAGFVFAGDRSSSVLLLPHSSIDIQHTFIAHAAGWQPLPEVAITLKRSAGVACSAGVLCRHTLTPPSASRSQLLSLHPLLFASYASGQDLRVSLHDVSHEPCLRLLLPSLTYVHRELAALRPALRAPGT
jgi:hypothetical protein